MRLQVHWLYADLWLGFTELEIERYLKGAGFKKVETAVVFREQEAARPRDLYEFRTFVRESDAWL